MQQSASIEDEANPLADAEAGWTDYGGLSIKGGSAGDYALETVTYTRIPRIQNEVGTQDGRSIARGTAVTHDITMLVIKNSGTYSIKNTNPSAATATGIRIAPGIKVDLTFEGVNIEGQFPMDIVTNSTQDTYATVEVNHEDVATKTTVHLTLADGTTNILKNSNHTQNDQYNTGYQFPGLRCGEGSVLTIDDAVRNVDTRGRAITPEHGIIPAGKSYVDKNGNTQTSTGKSSELKSSLSNLESKNPGTLTVYGGVRSAAIGGGPLEDSGYITINGGIINAIPNDKAGNGSGCGIGGGHAGGGTVTTFNGGVVTADASFHGAGIGGGCTYNGGMSRNNQTTTPMRDALLSRHANSTIAGDIIINGGFITAYGATHSNAFGQGCGGTNTGKTILITGGTLLPHQGGAGWYQIGGASGYVVITGGSVNCTNFQGNDNDGKSYGALNADGTPDRTKKVAMIVVDVKSKIDSMAKAANVTPDYNAKIEAWEMLVDKFPTDPEYGAASYLNDGKLYLWLPEGTWGNKQIDVNFSYYVGDTLLSSKSTVPTGSTAKDKNNNPIVKEYETFTLPEDFVKTNWTKYYDGTAIPTVDVSGGIPVTNPAGGSLKDNNSITYNYQRVDETNNALAAAVTGKTTPLVSGTYNMEVRSDEYAKNADFSNTYWGHSALAKATIKPVTSKTDWNLTQPATVTVDGKTATYTEPKWLQDDNGSAGYNAATNNHLVVPVDVTSYKYPNGDKVNGSDMSSVACQAPCGVLQLYIDGRAVPSTLGGTIEYNYDDLKANKYPNLKLVKDSSNREHVVGAFDLTRAQLEAFGLADKSADGNEHMVYVEYTSVSLDAQSKLTPINPRRTPDTANSSQKLFALMELATEAAGGEEGADATAAASAEAYRYADSAYTNYYESMTTAKAVEIEMADPDFKVYNEVGTGYVPNDTSTNNKLKTTDAEDVTKYGTNGYVDDVANFRDLLDQDGNVTATRDDKFPLYVTTNSIGNIRFESSNPAVVSVLPNTALTGRTYVPGTASYGVGAWAKVTGPGKTTITAVLEQTGAFKEAKRTFDVYIYPDTTKRPRIEVESTSYNTTRDDGTVRPGDIMRYTTTYTNVVEDSVYQNPVFKLKVPGDAEFNKLTVRMPDGTTRVLEEDKDFHIDNGQVIIDTFPAIYGGSSYQFILDAEVDPSAITKPTPDLASTSEATGVYGIDPEHNADYPWDTRIDSKDGTPIDPVNDTVDPTSPGTKATVALDPTELLGGEILLPEAGLPTHDSEDYDEDLIPPAVKVGAVTPGTPFALAKDAESGLTTPVATGEVIVKFGTKELPQTADDIKTELAARIAAKLAEDPTATEVVIPVVLQTQTTTPGATPTQRTVNVTVPIPQEMLLDNRDDHNLTIVPADVDPREDGNIVTTKTAVNVTPGVEKRANQKVVLIGDTIRYTIKVENTKAGSVWYNVVVKDPLPDGLIYQAGTAKVVDEAGVEHKDFTEDFDATSRTVGFTLGSITGGNYAEVSFDCVVDASATVKGAPKNVAYPYGTEPSTTVVTDPENPEAKVTVNPPSGEPGPYDPADDGKTWEDIEKKTEEEIKDIFDDPTGGDTDGEGGDGEGDGEGDGGTTPKPIIPSSEPADIGEVAPANVDHGKLSTVKTAKNLTTHEDGNIYVGDEVEYTIVLSNTDAPHTMWYRAVIVDELPAGMLPVSGSYKLVTPDGATTTCPDTVFSPADNTVTVYAGDLAGGTSATLTFKVTISKEAIASDIKNVAKAYGVDPSDVPDDVFHGDADLPEPGNPVEPLGDAGASGDGAGSAVQSGETYPTGYDPGANKVVGDASGDKDGKGSFGNDDDNGDGMDTHKGGVDPSIGDGSQGAPSSNNGAGVSNAGDGYNNSGVGGANDTMFSRALAATGDEALLFATGAGILAVVCGAAILLIGRRRNG